MLSLRILTAVVLLPPLLLGLFFLSPEWMAAVTGVFIAAGAWEWAALIGLSVAARFGYVVALVVSGVVIAFVGFSTPVLVVAAIGWTAVFVELARYPNVHEGWLSRQWGRAIAGFWVLVPAWIAFYVLLAADPRSPWILLFSLLVVWVADSLAYFAGYFFGRTKLAPSVSPGKTVEGVVGGLLGVVLLAVLAGILMWQLQGAVLMGWIALSVVAAIYSVAGDLLESKLKRVAGVKDSGRLLPGHGGVLDRIDALTAALPVFAVGWTLFFHGSP